jgi:hypothetical protein
MPVPTQYRPHISRPPDSHPHHDDHLTTLQRLALQHKDKPKQHPPSLKLATYNIQDGRNSRLVPVCRTLLAQHIDLALLTETCIPDDIHTRTCLGYNIFATYTTTRNQGGIALAYCQEAKNWYVEPHSPRPQPA